MNINITKELWNWTEENYNNSRRWETQIGKAIKLAVDSFGNWKNLPRGKPSKLKLKYQGQKRIGPNNDIYVFVGDKTLNDINVITVERQSDKEQGDVLEESWTKWKIVEELVDNPADNK